MTRRQALLAAGAVVAEPLLPALAAEETLGALAAAKGLLYGASFASHELDQPYGSDYAAMYRRECRILTSELEFKMHSFRPTADVIEFAPADRFMSFAEENGLPVRGHTLIWHDGLPDWINRLGPGEAAHLLEAHIETILERYGGRVRHWDVVNEPIGPWDHLPGNLRTGVFRNAFGEDYIARSFRLTRKLDKTARLVLNEAQTEADDENSRTFRESFMALVRRLLDAGVPLDAVGLESHLVSSRPYDFPRFAAWLEELAALGLEVHITELDVNDEAFDADIAKRDKAVANMYRGFLDAVLKVKAVTTVVNWQLADHTSWLYGAALAKKSRRLPRPLPYDSKFRRKPAWYAMAEAFAAAPAR
ncbi:MAG: endo-1,4-beta-xylanase [Hyphomicrobium sp.]